MKPRTIIIFSSKPARSSFLFRTYCVLFFCHLDEVWGGLERWGIQRKVLNFTVTREMKRREKSKCDETLLSISFLAKLNKKIYMKVENDGPEKVFYYFGGCFSWLLGRLLKVLLSRVSIRREKMSSKLKEIKVFWRFFSFPLGNGQNFWVQVITYLPF